MFTRARALTQLCYDHVPRKTHICYRNQLLRIDYISDSDLTENYNFSFEENVLSSGSTGSNLLADSVTIIKLEPTRRSV